MGQVFKAEHSVMGRVVAIKVLPLYKTTPDAVANFTHEIRALASLDHNRLVRALDAGHDGNVYYLVTEYVPGGDLRKLIRREGRLDMKTAAGIIYQVAEGLEHAHNMGLIHRDVKPGNVLVTPEGEAKLSDLGLAGPLEGDAESDPRFGKVVGTADYLSPDQIRSPWDPTPAWDIYSLGCTLYYAVTGKVPFPGGSTTDKARAHGELRPLNPQRLNKGLSDQFVDVIADMMAKNPSERIPSTKQVMARLVPWVDPLLITRAAQPELPKLATPPVVAPVARPLIATPPGSVPAGKPSELHLRDTESDYSIVTGEQASGRLQSTSQRSPNEANNPSAAARIPSCAKPQATGPVDSTNPEDFTVVETHNEPSNEPVSILRPLVVLVLTPLAIVSVVMLVQWLIQLLG
jgi:serine/threonine protein kinase